ncbi:hypothetical protein BCV69DRAFT_301568 [Microstroma glucosiphilum]|uniref:Uncharacterized protein n=1 Tax=Pseudomicrostroma glucosiphilum TaxID=1684307 RepID=A0A316TXU5_9BASI|nr:hypothetical protein BCV69DRAFT_301568 [Pseudomicrostroma glucosiphilum]PWN18112.1 hypothetical protein BCV69DRAFT_301568 [Pseudomicrostroma glucosiphilum]
MTLATSQERSSRTLLLGAGPRPTLRRKSQSYTSSSWSSSGSDNSITSQVDRSDEYDADPEDPSSDEDGTGRSVGDRYREAMASLAAGRLQYLAIPNNPSSSTGDQSLFEPSGKASRQLPVPQPFPLPKLGSLRPCGLTEVPETIEEESEGDVSPKGDVPFSSQQANGSAGEQMGLRVLLRAAPVRTWTARAADRTWSQLNNSGSRYETSWEQLAAPSITSQKAPTVRKRFQLRIRRMSTSAPTPASHSASAGSLVVAERTSRRGFFGRKRRVSLSRPLEDVSPRPFSVDRPPSALGLFTPPLEGPDDGSLDSAFPVLLDVSDLPIDDVASSSQRIDEVRERKPEIVVAGTVPLTQSMSHTSEDTVSPQPFARASVSFEAMAVDRSSAAPTAETGQGRSSLGGDAAPRPESSLRTSEHPSSSSLRSSALSATASEKTITPLDPSVEVNSRASAGEKRHSSAPRVHFLAVHAVAGKLAPSEHRRPPAKARLLLGIDQSDGSTDTPMQPNVAAESDWSDEDVDDVDVADQKGEERRSLRRQAHRQRSMELLTGAQRDSTSTAGVGAVEQLGQHHGLHAIPSWSAYEGETSIGWSGWRMCRVRGCSGSRGARAWPAQHSTAVVAAFGT